MKYDFMKKAIDVAHENIKTNKGGPFGSVIVKDNAIVGIGVNLVTSILDPTAHAEICAIRDASKNLNTFSLDGCKIYTTCEPCPMCLGAIYWARLEKIYYGASMQDAASVNFSDHNFYKEFMKPKDKRSIPMIQIDQKASLRLFEEWNAKEQKTLY